MIPKELRWWWLTSPSLISSIVILCVAVPYAIQVLPLPVDSVLFFMAAAGTLGAVCVGFRMVRIPRHLKPLALTARASVPVDVLKEAARRVAGLPIHQALEGMAMWLVGTFSLGFVDYFFGSRIPEVLVGTLSVGVFFAAITGLVSYVVTLRRSRIALAAIEARGLAAEQFAELWPRRWGIVRTLAVFSTIVTFSPVFATAYLMASSVRTELGRIADLPTEAERVVAVEVFQDLMLTKGLGVCVVLTLLAVGASLIGTDSFSAPIREMAKASSDLVQGKLSRPRHVPAEGEVWAFASAFMRSQQQLYGVLRKLKTASGRIGSTSEQILASSERFEMTAAEQAAALNETTATTEELARSAAQIAENAALVAMRAEQTLDAAKEGQHYADAFTASMARMREDNRSAEKAVTRLSKRVQQIGRIVLFINSVADKSDLLALSAELEGTKAGEVGRGFGLVASEMRRLAENIMESTREIDDLIREIREATIAAAGATEAGVRATEDGARHGGEVSDGLALIVSLAHETASAAQGISTATQNQQKSTDELAQGMARILQVTESNFRGSREAMAKNLDLSQVAAGLKDIVDRFEAKGS